MRQKNCNPLNHFLKELKVSVFSVRSGLFTARVLAVAKISVYILAAWLFGAAQLGNSGLLIVYPG